MVRVHGARSAAKAKLDANWTTTVALHAHENCRASESVRGNLKRALLQHTATKDIRQGHDRGAPASRALQLILGLYSYTNYFKKIIIYPGPRAQPAVQAGWCVP